MTLDERVADWKENHYIGVFTQALIVDLQMDRLALLGQVSHERIVSAELVIERDCIKSQRDELAATMKRAADLVTVKGITPHEIAAMLRVALKKMKSLAGVQP